MTRAEWGQVRRVKSRILTVERKEYPSESSPGKVYTARVEQDGKVLCDCRGWLVGWSKSGFRHCKHTRDLVGNRKTRIVGDFLYVERGEGTHGHEA